LPASAIDAAVTIALDIVSPYPVDASQTVISRPVGVAAVAPERDYVTALDWAARNTGLM
jgi:hypothetical protein